MDVMTAFFRSYGYGVGMVLFLICLCAGVAIHPVSGAGTSDTYEGYLGDTINLHGVSYVGSQVYLFFTGPNLPTNWVTLLNPALRADQGYFTIVDVDSDQQWSMKWNTARIENQIDPGTYTVYVVTAPVDRSSLAGTSYKTLAVYLKDAGSTDIHASGGISYTLHPEEHSSTATATPTSLMTKPTPEPMIIVSPVQTSMVAQTPVKKSAGLVVMAVIAVSRCGFVLVYRHKNIREP